MSRFEVHGSYTGSRHLNAARDLLSKKLRDEGATALVAWKEWTRGLGAYFNFINNNSVRPDDVAGLLQACRDLPMQISTAEYGQKNPAGENWHAEASLLQSVTLPEETPPMDAGRIMQRIIWDMRSQLEYVMARLEPTAKPFPHHILALSARSLGTTGELVGEYRSTIATELVSALANCGIAVTEDQIQVRERRPAQLYDAHPVGL